MTHPRTESSSIEGLHNFRDLGGLATTTGGRTRPGRLFRSGTLTGLTRSGLDSFKTLGIAAVFDLRSGPERLHSPSTMLEKLALYRWQFAHDESLGDPRPMLQSCMESAERTSTFMRVMYGQLPFDHRRTFAALAKYIAQTRNPTLYHCSAGKDRTGSATAVLLSIAGVERAEIYADYLRTNDVIDATIGAFIEEPRNSALATVSPEIWQPMLAARREYLGTMFESIDVHFGGMENYARQALELSSEEIDSLRAYLTE